MYGYSNIFANHFVVGGCELILEKNSCIEIQQNLIEWLSTPHHRFAWMFPIERICWINFLVTIDLEELNLIFDSLYSIYDSKYKFHSMSDFISLVFGNTIEEIEYFNSINPLPFGKLNEYFLYFYVSPLEKQYQIFIAERELEFYRQYFKKVLSFFESKSIHTSTKETEFTLKEIALLHFYLDMPINTHNRNEIAVKYGHNSGHKLYAEYNRFCKKNNRFGDSGNNRRQEDQIQRFRKIEPHIPKEKKLKFLEELAALENTLTP